MIHEPSTVIPLLEQDYPQWHKNRSYFCLWYIEIICHDILNYIQIKQSEFQHFLAPYYHRQAHITLFVNGFWVEQKMYIDDFNQQNLNTQIQALQTLDLEPFTLTLEHLHSFDNCLAIKIQHHPIFNHIRQVFNQTHQEISPSDYIPHITLGFYRESFLKQQILDKIQNTVYQKLSFQVDKLTFGYYHAQALQGQLSPIFQFHL